MILWTPYVFLRIALFFILGIVIGIYAPGLISITAVSTLLAGCIISFWILTFLSYKNVNALNPGFVGLASIMLIGYLNVWFSTELNNKNHFHYQHSEISFYTVTIARYAEEKENSWKAVGTVNKIYVRGEWVAASGRVLLYFSKKDFASPRYGEIMMIKGKPQEVPEPGNPHEFNYRRFLSFRNIRYQHFLQQQSVKLIAFDPPHVVLNWAYMARVRCTQLLTRYIEQDKDRAIALALILGVTDGLDNELVNAYAASGAMHVLAVSGLHVGVIYWLLLVLLKPLQRLQGGKWLIALTSILLLWMYAAVTGLSPSVLRAVTMFSFVALAAPLKQRTNIYNTLAASAVFILLYDPYMIMSVGFQLSYLAVIGIVYLYPRMYWWWKPNTWLMRKMWQITCVSIAAQIAIFSLGLLYFHQFPVYFLFSNLVVIPLSFSVLIVGLSLLVFSVIGPLAKGIGIILSWIIKALNASVFLIEDTPFSLLNEVYINTVQCWLLLGMVTFVLLLFHTKQRVFGILSAFLVVLFSVSQWLILKDFNGCSLTVYRVAGHSAFDILQSGRAYFFCDTSLLKDENGIRFHIHPNRLVHGIKFVEEGEKQPFVRKFPGCSLILLKGFSLLVIQQRNFNFVDSFQVDYVILSNNAIEDITRIQKQIHFKQLIIDSSNSYSLANKLSRQAQSAKLAVHSILHAGAFQTRTKL